MIGVMRCWALQNYNRPCLYSVRRSVHSTAFDPVFSIIWRLGVLSRIKNDSMVTYFYTGLEFHGCICGPRWLGY